MKLVFALVILIDGKVDAEATSYWLNLKRCRWYAEETEETEGTPPAPV
jgi:hypothetical protein